MGPHGEFKTIVMGIKMLEEGYFSGETSILSQNSI
jgi:hypothetical protein